MAGEISASGTIIGGIIGQRGAPGNGIASIQQTGESGLVKTYRITYTNGDTFDYEVTNGAKGDTGNGILNIEKTSTSGLVDTYTITYTNGTTDTLEVTNGEKGDTGNTPNISIGSVEKGNNASASMTGTAENPVLNLVLPKGDKGDIGNTPNLSIGEVETGQSSAVTITGTPSNPILNFTLEKGDTGATGETGNGIESIELTSTSGLVKTYTITFTDGTTTTFDVTDGEDGDVQDVQLNGTSIVDNHIANITGLATQAELDYYKTIYNVLPKVTGTGETLTLNNTGESILDLSLKGNTSQTGEPTPDTPIPVNVVSGDNEVVVCGKNLLPFTNQDFTLNSVRYYSQNGKLYLNGTSSSETNANNSNFKNNFAFTLEAGTYTFKKNIVGSRNQSYFFIAINKYDDDERLTRVNDTTSEATFTLTQTTKVYLGFYVYQQVFNAETFGLQLEKSSTVTTYEPYQSKSYAVNLGTMELCKIGDYQDYFYKDSDKWYLHKEIGEKTFMGDASESWSLNTPKQYVTQYVGPPITDAIYETETTKKSYTNYFSFKYGNPDDNTQIEYYWKYNTLLVLVIKNTTASTVAELKTWLNTHNVIFYYRLATPTNTEITDTTLIEQLDNLKSAMSYEGQTNISQVNDDKPFVIDGTALRSLLDYGSGE